MKLLQKFTMLRFLTWYEAFDVGGGLQVLIGKKWNFFNYPNWLVSDFTFILNGTRTYLIYGIIKYHFIIWICMLLFIYSYTWTVSTHEKRDQVDCFTRLASDQKIDSHFFGALRYVEKPGQWNESGPRSPTSFINELLHFQDSNLISQLFHKTRWGFLK